MLQLDWLEGLVEQIGLVMSGTCFRLEIYNWIKNILQTLSLTMNTLALMDDKGINFDDNAIVRNVLVFSGKHVIPFTICWPICFTYNCAGE